jgi:pimeloyl-ACP methyl ester carboxylesterase
MDEGRSDFSLDAHLDALDGMLGALDVEEPSLTVVGHSLGALLALHWAARNQRVEHVVAVCAPLCRDAAEADERIRAMGWMERVFALEGPAPEAACAWMCRHRSTAQWLTVTLESRWPVAIARMGVRHTWPSYLGAMNGVIRRGGWEDSLARLIARNVPVVLADGARDPVPVPGRSASLAATRANVRAAVHLSADHELPITDPDWCVSLVRGLPTQAEP